MRGIHWSASTDHSSALGNWSYWAEQLQAMGIQFVKLLDAGNGSSAQLCIELLRLNITPVVRMYRPRPNPGQLSAVFTTVPRNPAQLTPSNIDGVKRLVDVGVRYFETNNEPNLSVEWNATDWASLGWEDKVHLCMNAWVGDAIRVLDAGGLPAFPALAQCGHTMNEGAIGSIPFYSEAFRYLAAVRKEDVRQLFQRGAWLAVHDAVLNHFYLDEVGNWHFEYPYDPVCQKDQPGKTIMQDDNSLIGHRAPLIIIANTLGQDIAPVVISTEGGIFVPANGNQVWDNRYPAVTYQTQAQGTVAMFEWLERNAPEVKAMCPWLIGNETLGHHDASWTQDAWYHKDGPRPVVQAMRDTKPQVQPTEAQIREAAWQHWGVNIAYNPDAALQRHATKYLLGVPMTGEFDVGNLRCQGFALSIVYCVTGDWGNIKELPW